MNATLWKRVAIIGAIVVLVLIGALLQQTFWIRVLTLGLLFSAVAQSWNLMAGYAGQWSLAQLAFFGVGAYAAGILQQTFGIPLLIGLIPAILLTALFAAGIGYITLRLRGHYFSVVTFFLVVALFELVRYFADYTGGQYGLNLPFSREVNVLGLQFPQTRVYYFLALGVAIIATFVLWWVANSKFGLKLRAIRDDQDAAAALGVRVLSYKVIAMAISGAMAALAGVFYLATYKLMDADTAFGVHASLDPVTAGILGGAGQLLGGVLGELILQPVIAQVNQAAGSIPGLAAMIHGLILMLVILFLPKGIIGLVKKIRDNRNSRAIAAMKAAEAAEVKA
ncbi:MAG: branched-chain amino acid ABC transporter permease [Leucobacter sp.]|nr:branched-chain amino acid ABC transporter permease [Leucobacter sp.]